MRAARVIAGTGVVFVAAGIVRGAGVLLGIGGTPAPGWPWAFGIGVLLITGGSSYCAGWADGTLVERAAGRRAQRSSVASIPQGAVRQDASLTGGLGIPGKTPAAGRVGGQVIYCNRAGCHEWFVFHSHGKAVRLGWLPDQAFAPEWMLDDGERVGTADSTWWCREHQGEGTYPS